MKQVLFILGIIFIPITLFILIIGILEYFFIEITRDDESELGI